jgi:hypothetical protein
MKQQVIQTAALAALLTVTTSCSLSAHPPKWEKFTFNGQEFQSGGIDNRPAIWLRDGYSPRIAEPQDASLDYGKLPPKSGAIAGVCYLQISGGKLADQSGAKPLPDEQITISSSKYGISVTRSDAAGFFIEELFPGDYQLYCRGAGLEVRVKEGQTVLVPIKGAKRMVD